jgi:hypothetical protein
VGPMSVAYAEPVQRVISRLRLAGLRVHYLDLTVWHLSPLGCNGHPGVEVHRRVFEKARAEMAQALGWA